MKKPALILGFTFFVVTCFLIRENWDLVPGVKVTEVIESPSDSTMVDSTAELATADAKKEDQTGQVAGAATISDPVFESFLDEISETLPTKEEYRYLTAAEAHGHPRLLLQTALSFGELADKLQNNVSLRPKGLEFYKGCALNGQLVNSVRAVCFHHAQILEIDLHARLWHFQPDQIPSSVVELAKTL